MELSAKIRVSFETLKELQHIIELLGPAVKSYKVSDNTEGKYRKAYIEIYNNLIDKK